jgi:hypothetical protein
VIVAGSIAVTSGVIGWRIALGHYRERLETQKVIIDDYREKLKGQSPAEASQQIRQLEEAVASMRWRTVTPEQKKLFREAIPSHTRLVIWEISCVAADAEAESYLKQLLHIFYDPYVPRPAYNFNAYPSLSHLEKRGLLIVARNTESPNVQTLTRALGAAKIPYYLTSEGIGPNGSDDFLLVRVGPKPNENSN